MLLLAKKLLQVLHKVDVGGEDENQFADGEVLHDDYSDGLTSRQRLCRAFGARL